MTGTEWREAQIRDLKNVLKDLRSDIPLVFVSGNHDLGNTPTPETISNYCQQWGDDYFSFWVGGVFFLVLNSQLYFDASQCSELKAAQDAWLEQQLAVARKKQCRHAVVFQHIPFFFMTRYDNYPGQINLVELRSAKEPRGDLKTESGIKTVFSGHLHKNAGGTYKDLDMVISSAIGCQLGEDPHGVRMVGVTAEKIVHRYYSLSELRAQYLLDT
ncbi:hypothetical protein E2320_012087 [Naja naja]|nr:hypothetical protein E2320_012087 [Naja naja]